MRSRRKILLSEFRSKWSRFHFFKRHTATESLRKSQLLQPVAGQRNVGGCQSMSCAEKSDGDLGTGNSQKFDKALCFRGWNNWIVVSRSDPNANVRELRSFLRLKRHHRAKQNCAAQSFRAQQ